MTDNIPVDRRSWNMARIKSKNTAPELLVRKHLYSNGIRYRLHQKDLPGKPDIIISKIKTAIFVHGCFWHQHPDCKRSSIPKTRKNYWLPKLHKNTNRDIMNQQSLASLKWTILIIWECETRFLSTSIRIAQLIDNYGKAK